MEVVNTSKVKKGEKHNAYGLSSWILILRDVLKQMVIYFANWNARLTDVTELCLRENTTNGYHNIKSQSLTKCQ